MAIWLGFHLLLPMPSDTPLQLDRRIHSLSFPPSVHFGLFPFLVVFFGGTLGKYLKMWMVILNIEFALPKGIHI